MKRLLFAILFVFISSVCYGAPFIKTDIQSPSINKRVATIADAEALTGSATVPAIYLEARGGGVFIWNGSDLSTEVIADTEQGIYIAPSSDPTGTSGAWVRSYTGPVNVLWFGAVGDGSPEAPDAINAAQDFATSGLVFPEGRVFLLTGSAVFDKSDMTIDLNGSTIRAEAAGIVPVRWSDTAYVFNSRIINGSIESGPSAGNVLSIPYGIAYCELDVSMKQENTSKSILSETYNGSGGIYDSKFKGGVWMLSNTHTVYGFEVVTVDTSRFNGNEFSVNRYDKSGTKQFFRIECQAANWNYDNVWRDSTFETTIGGNILCPGSRGFQFENLRTWDLAAYGGGVTVANLYDFGTSVGLASIAPKFKNVGRTDGTLGGGLYDINIGDCTDYTIEHGAANAAIGTTHNLNGKRGIVIHDVGLTLVNRNKTNSLVIGPNGFDGTLGEVRYEDGGELTISGGVITTTLSRHRVDTEADAATDDLDTITAGADGQILKIRPENDTRDVVVKHGTGNIRLNGGIDFTMDRIYDSLTLMWDGTAARWIEQARMSE